MVTGLLDFRSEQTLIHGIEGVIITQNACRQLEKSSFYLTGILLLFFFFLQGIVFPVQLDEELILLKGKSGVLRLFLFKLELGNSPLFDVGRRTDVSWRMRGRRTPGSSGGDRTIHCSADFLDLYKISHNRHCWSTVISERLCIADAT